MTKKDELMVESERFVRHLDKDEVQLIEYLSKRGYGNVYISGFMGVIATLGVPPSEALKRIEETGYVDGPSQGVVRSLIEKGDSPSGIIRRSTPKQIREYVDINQMSYDLYDTFNALSGMVQDMEASNQVSPVELTRVSRAMKELYESLQKGVQEGRVKTQKPQINVFNFSQGLAETISPECQFEVDEVIKKHMALKRAKEEAIDV